VASFPLIVPCAVQTVAQTLNAVFQMSAIGSKQTRANALHMSAFGGKADMTTYSTFSKSGKFYAHSIDCHRPSRLKIRHRFFARLSNPYCRLPAGTIRAPAAFPLLLFASGLILLIV
jgi:hypothetical protein